MVHERLGRIALIQSDPRRAVTEFERELKLDAKRPGVALELGKAWRRLGDNARARDAYRRELRLNAGSAEAMDSLDAIGGAAR
jgi:Flp pilus assembly protein TadD